MNINLLINNLANKLLSLLFPIECLGCSKENTYLCDDCFNSIKIHQTVEPFEHPLKYVDEIWTAADYKNKLIQTMIHNFKFRYIKELAKPLSNLLIQYYINISRYTIRDMRYTIIPVPLNKKRLLERDFNQAELIGNLFSDYFGYPIMTDVIERSRHTPHQVGLNQEQRKTNIQNAFKILKPDFIKNKNIILIDDVVTTGSTLEEIAKVLKENGANKIYGLAAAKD